MNKFITFEGGEGVGKTTQIKLLKEHLEAHNHKVVVTREPGGTELAENIRDLVLNHSEITDPLTEFLLITAGRYDHVKNFIKPHLENNYFVLCDRFYDSSFVYQGVAKGLDTSVIKKIQKLVLQDFTPDLTFVLDIDPTIAQERLSSRSNNSHYDNKEIEFHTNIRNSFLKLAQDNLYMKVINANLATNEVFKDIITHIQ